jgi:hypothetical protein
LNPLIFCTDLYLSCAYTVSQALILSCITFFCCYALCILGAARLLSLLFGFFCCFLRAHICKELHLCVTSHVPTSFTVSNSTIISSSVCVLDDLCILRVRWRPLV